MERAALSLPFPDDLLLEILVRVKDDMAALFRCAIVCKLWHRLVANPSFLRRCWPEDTPASIAGFFTREQRPGQGVGAPCFVPAPRSAMGRGCRALTTFVQPAGQKVDHAEPLVSRHGLLLVRLPPHDTGVVHLAVCNLLVGECHVLPPLKCGKVDPLHLYWSGYAILSGVDSCSHNEQPPPSNYASSFKVVIIDSDYNLYTFSSHKRSWSTATRCFGDEATSNYTAVYHGPAVVCRGTAHWLFYDGMMLDLCIVGMKAKTGHVSLTRIPFVMDDMRCRPCLTLSTDGTLSLIYIDREGPQVVIWEIVDETTNCLCTRSIELQEPGKKLTQSISSLHMLGEKYGTMIAQGSSLSVYVVDLETETVEELVDWPNRHANRVDVVPLQMSWLKFFLSRLGIVGSRGRCSKALNTIL